MESNSASRTAVGAARLRLAHQLLDSDSKILQDPVIGKLLGEESLITIRKNKSLYQTPESLSLRSSILLRSRFAEDCLYEAYGNGARQYLILGAGLDTFAYRQPKWANQLTIFEVDHPSTQEEKRNRLCSAQIDVPGNLVYVPIDFESESLADRLTFHGFRRDMLSFSSWLGVTVYLSIKAVDEMLKLIVSFAAGSEIVFSFAQKSLTSIPDNRTSRENRKTLADVTASIGEPWTTYFTLEEIENKLKQIGFSSFKFLDLESAQEYYQGRNDGLKVPRRISLVRAVV